MIDPLALYYNNPSWKGLASTWLHLGQLYKLKKFFFFEGRKKKRYLGYLTLTFICLLGNLIYQV